MPLIRMFAHGFLSFILIASAACSKNESAPVTGVVINELMASNKSGLRDEDNALSDWIELKNLNDGVVSLGGWSLTDEPANPEKWTLPAIDIAPGGFVVIYASGKDRRGSSLHTNFKLNAAGEYLGLFNTDDKSNAQSELTPGYEEQRADTSYGTHADPGYFYLETPTPGAENLSSALTQLQSSGLVLSHTPGLFFEPIELQISGEGKLYYSTDGTLPTLESPEVSGAIALNTSTQVRVLRVPLDGSQNVVETHIFLRAESSLRNVKSHLPIVVVDVFENDGIDDEGRPRTYHPSGLIVFESGAEGEQTALSSMPAFVGRSGMHIRGNSTASYDKKQYSLETWDEADKDHDVSLLGFPKDSDWVLHAPFADKTLMRNHLMYEWSRRIGRYASRTQFIELYLNRNDEVVTSADYVGVYVLMEKVKQGKDRVNVANLPSSLTSEPGISGGYLLEKGWNFSEEIGIRTGHYEDELQFIYPKAEEINTEQRRYLQSFFDAFEDSLAGDAFADPVQGYASYIDVDSFIDHHLLVEFARNIDGYVLSTYMHKDREGLLNMGPIWDYNGALGNPDYFEGELVEGWHYNNPEFPADNPNAYHWYTRLFEDQNFRNRYAARWVELRQGVFNDETMMADIEATVTVLGTARERNFERWNVLGEYVWPNAPGWDERDTFRKEVDYMKDWIRQRASWMDSQLIDNRQ